MHDLNWLAAMPVLGFIVFVLMGVAFLFKNDPACKPEDDDG